MKNSKKDLLLHQKFLKTNTGVAQSVEHRSPKPGVGSSSLSARAQKKPAILAGFFFCTYYFRKNYYSRRQSSALQWFKTSEGLIFK